MSAKGNKGTTMAKVARENRLRERRLDKKAKKDARKHAADAPEQTWADEPTPEDPSQPIAQPTDEPVREAPATHI